MTALEKAADVSISTFDDLTKALTKRLDHFEAHGCKISDHALDVVMFGVITSYSIHYTKLYEIFTPAFHRFIVNVLMQFTPVWVLFTMLPEALDQCHQHRVLRRFRNLNMELFIPL